MPYEGLAGTVQFHESVVIRAHDYSRRSLNSENEDAAYQMFMFAACAAKEYTRNIGEARLLA